MTIKIIQDTREKKDKFFFYSYSDVELVVTCLKTGDYSIVGYEDKITIDRKCSTQELQICFGQQWKRFHRELERMSSFDEAYIMCSFPYEHLLIFPNKSGIPFSKLKYIKMTGSFLRKRIYTIEEEFPNIKFLFNDTQEDAEHRTYEILRNYYDKQNNSK